MKKIIVLIILAAAVVFALYKLGVISQDDVESLKQQGQEAAEQLQN